MPLPVNEVYEAIYQPNWNVLPPHLALVSPFYETTLIRRIGALFCAVTATACALVGLRGRVSLFLPSAALGVIALLLHYWPPSQKAPSTKRIEAGKSIDSAKIFSFKDLKRVFQTFLDEGLITPEDINRLLRKDLEQAKLSFTSFQDRHGEEVIPYLDEHNRSLLRLSYIDVMKHSPLPLKEIVELPWSKVLNLSDPTELMPELINNNQAILASPGYTFAKFTTQFSWIGVKYSHNNLQVLNLLAEALKNNEVTLHQRSILYFLHLINCGKYYLGVETNPRLQLVPITSFPENLQTCLQTYKDKVSSLSPKNEDQIVQVCEAFLESLANIAKPKLWAAICALNPELEE